MREGNRLLPPDAVHLRDDRLVFFEEEQGAILWGAEPEGDDPPVWQGVIMEEGDDIFWYDEEMSVSVFLVAMLRWKISGEAPEKTRAGPEGPALAEAGSAVSSRVSSPGTRRKCRHRR